MSVAAASVTLSTLSNPTSDQAELYAHFAQWGLKTETYDHPAVFSVAESDYLRALIPGTHCRSLLLTNKTGGVWMISAADDTVIDLKHVSQQLDTPRFSFAKAEQMVDILRVTPGSLTPFALLFDTSQQVTFILDAALQDQAHCVFHPLQNTQSTVMAVPDLIRFATATGHTPHIMPLSPLADPL